LTEPEPPAVDSSESLLLTDLYQFAMLQAYLEEGATATAVFELFVRKLPPSRNFLVAGGLQQAVEFICNLRFGADELAWLGNEGGFSPRLIDSLRALRFTGDVDAMPEGTLFFPDEPILRVTAPLPEAQLVETRLINLLQFQTIVASKAARMVLAAGRRQLVDFGLRRAHGAEAGLLAARAAYLAGFDGTATVLAKRRFGIPVFGTMAHSFVQAHDSEEEAFMRFAAARPDRPTLLIDTYDTEAGARIVVGLAPRLAAQGITVAAVRLDSGDLAALSRRVRAILDQGGLNDVKIFVSGGLDEGDIAALVGSGAPVDGFGVGTSLTTSADAPALDCAYKLQEYAGVPRRKRSAGKATWPGRKQVWRKLDAEGRWCGDVVGLATDEMPGEPLIMPVLRQGALVSPLPSLEAVRARTLRQLSDMPPALRSLQQAEPYPVTIADSVRALADAVDRRMALQDRKAADAINSR
jgi:nicotinate phosphoribosyltransferase